jgi:hypothetical protein
MAARPPIKAAHEAATKTLIEKHRSEWDDLVANFLANLGWEQREVTMKKWQHS